MIGDDKNEAGSAADYITGRDNSAEIRAQAERQEFIRQNQEILGQLRAEFAEAPFAGTLESVAERLGTGVVESWKYAFTGPMLEMVAVAHPKCPRPIQLGATIEHLSWAGENPTLPVRAFQGMILRYRQFQGVLLPEGGATERTFHLYPGMSYHHQDNEHYRERGLFVVAYQPLNLNEPAMISFGDLDEAKWRDEGSKLVATEGMRERSTARQAGLTVEQDTFVQNLFGVQTVRENHWFLRDKVFVNKGLFRTRERAFVPGHHLSDMDEFDDAVRDFVDRYHNPIHTNKRLRKQAEEELYAARERVRMGDDTTFLAYNALARALKRPPEIIVNPEILNPCAKTSATFWQDSLMSMRDYPLYQRLNQESLNLKRAARNPDGVKISYQKFYGGDSDVDAKFLEIASQYYAKHGSLKGLLY